MRKYLGLAIWGMLGLGAGLRADYERPGPGPDLDALRSEGDRPWTLWLRTYMGYSDNVQILADHNPFFSGDMDSGYIGFTAAGSYRFWEQDRLEAGVAMRLDQTLHFKGENGSPAPGEWTDEPNNFDLTVVEPALYLKYRCEEGAMPYYGRLAYSFRWEDSRDTGIGLTSHNLGFTVGVEPRSDLHVELAYQHGWDDFDVSFINQFSDRDAERDRVSLSLIHPGSENTPRMILRYSYLNNDADGRNFEYDGSEVMFRVESYLFAKLSGALQFSYGDFDYRTFRGGPPRTEQEVFKAGVQLVWAIDRNWAADFYYSYWNIDSDASLLEAEINDVGVGLRYTF